MRAHLSAAVLALVTAFAADPALAAAPPDPVPGHPGLRYQDLLRQVVPDLAENASTHDLEGHLPEALRHVAGGDNGGDPPDPVTVGFIEAARIRAGGRPRLAVLAELGHTDDRVAGTVLLALFDDAPKPKLLDAVDVGMDRDSSLSEHPLLHLSPRDDALVTYSEHFNTGQTYAFHTVVFVREGRWALLGQVFTLSDRSCGWQTIENPTFKVRPDPGRAYGQLEVTVREQRKVDPTQDCDEARPRPYVRLWRAVYRWEARKGRFATASSALKRLDKINESRF
ncbi:MAG TPA: hypothetical protein VG939_13620 [Caulobacteraceae bacterium]|nr:hypothetical protein [Caulobacteraceae bacterium]